MDVGAEVLVAPAVDGVIVVDGVLVVVGAAESPPPPHAGNNTAMPKTASIDTAFRTVIMPGVPPGPTRHSIKLENETPGTQRQHKSRITMLTGRPVERSRAL
jgi:hypothetical protein